MRIITLNRKNIERDIARLQMFAARERCGSTIVEDIALTHPNRHGLYCAIFMIDPVAEEFIKFLKEDQIPHTLPKLDLLGVSPTQPLRRIADFLQRYFEN